MDTLILRSMMSVPGIRERFIEKARAIPADILCFDLEDSVAWDDKPTARNLVARTLPDFPANGRLIVVRINGLDTGLAEQDLDAVVHPWLHGINLPKCHNAAVVQQVDTYLTYLERTRDIPPGQIKLIPWIETAEGIAKALEVCTASDRTIAAAFGGEDYTADLGITRTATGNELQQPRAIMANAALAAGIVPIDTPEPDFSDPHKFDQDVQVARSLGYRGKFCIHPTQVDAANRAFAPSDDELAWADRVIESYEDGTRRGLGAVSLDGTMIDKPVADRAYGLRTWRQRIAEREALLQTHHDPA